jgi:2,3-bisphosphoglycerate-dependent phosphoglycerate mutase
MSSELVVVRHGQSTWNVEHRFTGQADPPLSELGRRQAVALADACSSLRLDAVVTSDLTRSYETGAVVAARLGLSTPVRLPELRERWSDALAGLHRDDIEATHPGQLAAWRQARPVDIPGEHEPFSLFAERVIDGLVRASGQGGRVLVVAHAGIFVVLGTLDGFTATSEVANTEGRWLTVSDGVVDVGDSFLLAEGWNRTGQSDP